MTIQRSVAARNAQLNAFETTVGTAPILELRTGAQPANCAAADSGTLLASMTLPSDWMADAAAGVKGFRRSVSARRRCAREHRSSGPSSSGR